MLYYKCHKINFNCGGSYKDSSHWIKNKKATINTINKKIINAFNTLLKRNSQRITKIKTFTNKYKWERIKLPSEKDAWKKLENNNVTSSVTMKCFEC